MNRFFTPRPCPAPSFWLLCLWLLSLFLPAARAGESDGLRQEFVSPPAASRPWVYWYFMDGNQTRVGIHADLEAMKKAGIGGVIMLDVNIGIPRGPVSFMGEEWQSQFAYAVSEAKRLGLQIALGAGPGWCGAGGPWITPDQSMQHLVASEATAAGPSHFDAVLPRPQPRTPFFGEGTLTPELHKLWADFYRDEYVIAFPTPAGAIRLSDTDKKALYYRGSVSSRGEIARLPSPIGGPDISPDQCVPVGQVVDITDKLGPDGRLSWDVPAGQWTIMRFGRTATGQTTRPAPTAGLGFETDKFSRPALDAQFRNFEGPLLRRVGPAHRVGDSGLTMLHFDSWEMGSQNWSPRFRQEFITRCGYDPLPYLPAMTGRVVGSVEQSERFLWDLRQTASDLVVQNQAQYLAQYAHAHGMTLSLEPYDLNPSADLDLGSAADLPMGEFWSPGGFPTAYSCTEAVSVGHTNGKPIIGAELFTSRGDAWRQYPGSMKAQTDWALGDGLNKFVIHRYQHQPEMNKFPGMTMGPYGVYWERTQTWWDMVGPFHEYMARCCQMLRQGLPVADILYLTPEGAPQVFTPPPTAFATHGGFPDRQGYNFDGCSPETLMRRASVQRGRIVFPDGMSYRLLVLPNWDTMTPRLLRKVTALVRAGATVVGTPPVKSPSLAGYPACDATVRALTSTLWGTSPLTRPRRLGLGQVIPPAFKSVLPLGHAQWIWFPEGQPAQAAPPGSREFRATLTLPAAAEIRSAVAVMTADNSFVLTINGHVIGGGNDFNLQPAFDIAAALKPGPNEVRVTATNLGDAPSPAGLIGSLSVTLASGERRTLDTGIGWEAAQTPAGPWSPALALGPDRMRPWSIDSEKAYLYPDYSWTADTLAGMGTVPDFSADVPLRYTHRRLASGDIYFVANTAAQAVRAVCTFRTAGFAPEWWDPLTGETRDLGSYAQAGGVTRLPLDLGPGASGFVVFRRAAARPHGAGGSSPTYRTALTLGGPWQVSFDPRWGGPAAVTFPALADWNEAPVRASSTTPAKRSTGRHSRCRRACLRPPGPTRWPWGT